MGSQAQDKARRLGGICSLLLSSFLRLPNEILCQIFTCLPDSRSYLSLQAVNWRLHAAGAIKSTRRRFAKEWFSAHCNDANGEAPSLFEYLARYVRLHCAKGTGHELCALSTQADIGLWPPNSSDWPHIRESRLKDRTTWSWRHQAFSGLQKAQFSSVTGQLLAKILARIDASMERLVIPKEGWNIKSIGKTFELPDVAFAEAMCRLYFERKALVNDDYHSKSQSDLIVFAMYRVLMEKQSFGELGEHCCWQALYITRDVWKCGCVLFSTTTAIERQGLTDDMKAKVERMRAKREKEDGKIPQALKVWHIDPGTNNCRESSRPSS
ncbi:hypothetical protein BJ508DRAFT_334549 [Ascobolus immersus RN42]|uniref:F-box domain-containing protein n=1 Tax=Ascobolus immersus RN42 TaxID=1160509 RepID=A0A3N4HLI8_ASCIM|nr:hypothetical protein BJ508DRAFT_334549 [Ascobolus immersus RN42]